MDIDIICQCGNPDCKLVANMRRGAVYYSGSNEPAHWNQLYINLFGLEIYQDREVMADPKEARRLMWFLIREYMPILAPAWEFLRKWATYFWHSWR